MQFNGLTIKDSGEQSIITLDEAKAQLHILDNYEDEKIKASIESAVAYCENYLWQSLRPQTIVASYTPDGRNFAELFRGTFNGLVGVKYFDESGKAQNIASGDITVDDSLPVPRAYFTEPKTSPEMFGAIKIEYTAKAPATLSQQVKQAALIATAQFFDDRDAPDLSAVDKILNLTATRYFL